MHLNHLFGLFLKRAFWPKSRRSVVDRTSTVGGSPKKKFTTYFLSLSAGFAANMPGLSPKHRDIPHFNRDGPEEAELSALDRTYDHPTFYLPPSHLSPFPAPPEINFSTPG